jgi:cold shock protein
MNYAGDVVYPTNFEDNVVEDQNCEVIECIVKWFNPVKGFGFVIPKVSSEDIFLHFSVVDAAGFQHLGAGTELLCKICDGQAGRQVREIMEVRNKVEGFDCRGPSSVPNRSLQEMYGIVKWFNAIRGFGFIMPKDSDREIFVHSSVLRRHGMEKLQPGDQVRMQVAFTDQGPQAWSVTVLKTSDFNSAPRESFDTSHVGFLHHPQNDEDGY